MKRSALGLILVLLGALFLLRNIGWMPDITYYIFRWPNIMFLIAIGFLISGKPKPALVFVLIGGFFWFQRYFYFDMNLLWPVILIVLGVAFILRQRNNTGGKLDDSGSFDSTNIFSGSQKKFSSQAFTGGKLTTVFGGAEIDLREAVPAEGAVIDVFCMFGGVELKAPANWNINVTATPIFGGISDERDKITQDGPEIRITGFVMFGGVEIKN